MGRAIIYNIPRRNYASPLVSASTAAGFSSIFAFFGDTTSFATSSVTSPPVDFLFIQQTLSLGASVESPLVDSTSLSSVSFSSVEPFSLASLPLPFSAAALSLSTTSSSSSS